VPVSGTALWEFTRRSNHATLFRHKWLAVPETGTLRRVSSLLLSSNIANAIAEA
jgi:hypothetical protein